MFAQFLNRQRMRFAIKWGVGHFMVSAGVACTAAYLVFNVWYPSPWHEVLGVSHIFLLMLIVDVVCGPLLTMIVASPFKKMAERCLDMAFVGCIQLVALAYGLHSAFEGRPIALVFEKDRFVMVRANEIDSSQLVKAKVDLKQLPWRGIQYLGVRQPQSSEEFLSSINQTLSGVPPSLRPDWWIDYAGAKPMALEKTKPLQILLDKRPQNRDVIMHAVQEAQRAVSQLSYLPLTSYKTTAWIVLLTPQADIVAYVPVDGFD